ncbi:DUF3849 domain-containing protein [Bengtsoniella intestinalis]|uniref:DUF3849 domain-containing protein n=1 Tax=Bengtsoniella intestinalis TaxID=3073143 RepID=UPI00391F79C1
MQTKEFVWVYPYSRSTAKEQGQMEQYTASLRENNRCADCIEETIKKRFDGATLERDAAKEVIAEFGFHRVSYVLANTVQSLKQDGRFSRENKAWAENFSIPSGVDKMEFRLDSHPAVVDGFINQTRRAYQELGLFDNSHCPKDSFMEDFTDKVVVLSASALKANYLAPEHQLWLAESGFGCRPDTMGNAVFATCLATGDKTRLERYQLVGTLAEEHMPQWAKEKLEQLQQGQEPPTQEMEGMTMQ